jgi:hypothetical protein
VPGSAADLEQQADAAQSQKSWITAAVLYERAAAVRGDSPEAAWDLSNAARCRVSAGQIITARRLIDRMARMRSADKEAVAAAERAVAESPEASKKAAKLKADEGEKTQPAEF